MAYVISLDEVNASSKNVGAKAANLGEMLRVGLPVPSGFVVTTESYELFLRFNRLDEKIPTILKGLDIDNPEQLKQKSKEIEDLFIKSEIPDPVRRPVREFYENMGLVKEARNFSGPALDIIKAGRDRVFVAVRSYPIIEDPSKTSFAGQTRSYINISGTDQLMEALKRCWSSLFTPRAIFYRKKQNIESQIIGVVTQKMIDSDKSGILFTEDPTETRKGTAIIEASWGLGPSIASGLVTPDIYILDKGAAKVADKKISKKTTLLKKDQTGKTIRETVSLEKSTSQTLSEFELSRLLELGKKAESVFGCSQDIEWCIERGRIFLVQSRPITTLNKNIKEPDKNQLTEALFSGIPASKGFGKGKIKIINNLEELSKAQQNDIIVSKIMTPEFLPYMGKIAGIITDEGGITSQAATICREFEMPFISGANRATQAFLEGQEVIADGFSGKIYSPKTQEPEASPEPTPAENKTSLTATEIRITLSSHMDSKETLKAIDGVGLLRSEHILTEQGKNPIHLAKTNPNELVQLIMENVGKVASAFYPKPVWYRSLDIRTDEYQNPDGLEEYVNESNPLLGWHGIRRSLGQPEIIKCELEALKKLHESGLKNISLLLPFVINAEEIRSVKNMIEFPLKIGIVVETPAAVLDLDRICKEGIDFVSIDSNDLTQLTLGVDRANPNTSTLYSETHPSVLSLIKKTIETCKKHGVKTSIFGEGPSNLPELVEKLVEFGIDSISVEPDAIQTVQSAILRAEKRLLLDKIRNSTQQ